MHVSRVQAGLADLKVHRGATVRKVRWIGLLKAEATQHWPMPEFLFFQEKLEIWVFVCACI